MSVLWNKLANNRTLVDLLAFIPRLIDDYMIEETTAFTSSKIDIALVSSVLWKNGINTET